MTEENTTENSQATDSFIVWKAPKIANAVNRYIEPVEMQEARKKAYEEGYAAGLDAGEKEGLQQQQQQSQQILEKLNFTIDNITTAMSQVNDCIEDEIVNHIIGLAKYVALKEITTSPENIAEVFKAAIEHIPVLSSKVYVRLNQEDYNFLETNGYLKDIKTSDKFIIKSDSEILAGGCTVNTDECEIDASLEQRLEEIAKKFFQSNECNTNEKKE